MNNFKISKNTEWKEVEINGELQTIPSNWGLTTIEEVSKVTFGQSPENFQDIKKEANHESLEFHQGNSFFSKKYLEQSNSFINNSPNFKKAFENAIVMSVRAPVGELNITKKNIVIGRGLAAIEQNNPLTYYTLKSVPVQNYMKKISSGSIFESIKSSDLKKIKIINPISQEKNSIASILSAQESIINDMETLVEKYETRLRYLSEELLSGRLRIKEVDGKTIFYKNTEWKEVEINGEIKEIPVDWDKVNIGSPILPISKTGVEPYADNKKYYATGEVTQFCLSQEPTGIFNYSDRPSRANIETKKDTIYFARMKATLKVLNFISNPHILLSTGFLAINFDSKKIMQDFLFHNIISSNFQKEKDKFCHGSTQESLSDGEAEKLFIFYPILSEQLYISNILTTNFNILNKQKELLEKEKKKFTFLLNNLLSGNYLVENIQ